MNKLIGLVVAIAATCAAVPLLGAAAIFGAGGGTCAPAAAPGSAVPRPGERPAIDRWDPEQVSNVATIVAVGNTKGIPAWGWVIGVATAMQESGLRNLTGGDRDSIGLFQQRPSQGWGTPQQLADPAYQAGKFFDKLITIDGWQQMPLTDAAQAVQRSAYPDAYAKHEPDAITVVAKVSGLAQATLAGCGAAGTWTQPVHGPVVSGFRTPQRPTHHGVDIAASTGTTIAAASAGTVTVVACQAIAPDGSDYGCDRDGSPAITGCGWYVDIAHGGGIMTRYCHLKARPQAFVGQSVAPGEPIGLVGTSGNSSGPHLHFEVHVNNRSSNGAVGPELFMREHGAPLGQPS